MTRTMEKWDGGVCILNITFIQRSPRDRDPLHGFRYACDVPTKAGGVRTLYYKPRGPWLAWIADTGMSVAVKAKPKAFPADFVETVLTDPDFGFAMPNHFAQDAQTSDSGRG